MAFSKILSYGSRHGHGHGQVTLIWLLVGELSLRIWQKSKLY